MTISCLANGVRGGGLSAGAEVAWGIAAGEGLHGGLVDLVEGGAGLRPLLGLKLFSRDPGGGAFGASAAWPMIADCSIAQGLAIAVVIRISFLVAFAGCWEHKSPPSTALPLIIVGAKDGPPAKVYLGLA